MSPDLEDGIEQFLRRLTELGLNPRVEAELLFYDIQPVEGARAGRSTRTAVAVAELRRWPLVPPHWVHVSSEVGFKSTNSRPSPRRGWTMHSRQIVRWGEDSDPEIAWVSHVRGVLGEATT